MLTGLEIYRFRGIRELKLNGLAQVNVLMGRNNAGKSSVLEALYLASAAFRLEDPLGRGDKIEYLLNRRGKRGLSWEKGRETLWYGYDNEEAIMIKLRAKDEELYAVLRREHEHPLVMVAPLGRALCLYDGLIYDIVEKRYYRSSSEFPELSKLIDKAASSLRNLIKDTVFVDAALLREVERVEERLWTPLFEKGLDVLVIDILKTGYDVDIEYLTYVPFHGVYQLVARMSREHQRYQHNGLMI